MKYSMVSIILPVYNQAEGIRQVVESYVEALTNVNCKYEMILIVNGSNDESLAICQQLSKNYSQVRLIASTEKGWGRAVRLGLREAKGDLLCYTNSARTSAQDLTQMLVYALTNPGVVIKANRKIRESWRRKIGSLLYNIECRTLFDLAYWDINGTPKLFPRTFQRLVNLERNDNLIDLEFNIVCQHENHPMLEVPVFSVKRFGGESTTNFKSAFEMYYKAFVLWKNGVN